MRIDGIDPEQAPDSVARVLKAQRKKWGEPLSNHLIYARVPDILHGAQGMWRGLGSAGLIESNLSAILNRRVAILNGCVF